VLAEREEVIDALYPEIEELVNRLILHASSRRFGSALLAVGVADCA